MLEFSFYCDKFPALKGEKAEFSVLLSLGRATLWDPAFKGLVLPGGVAANKFVLLAANSPLDAGATRVRCERG